jgi:hypothetical protein
MSNSDRKKPTGKMGSLRVQMGPGQGKQTFFRAVFPTTKREIEAAVPATALAAPANQFAIGSHYGLVGKPVQNDENDFDFTLPTDTGQTYLDLMEIAPLEEVRGSYEHAGQMVWVGKRADWIAAKVFEKSGDYGRGPASGVHLLLYTTDFRFDAMGYVCDLLVHLLHGRAHCFGSVAYCSPLPSDVHTRLLFPLPAEGRSRLQSEGSLRQLAGVPFDLSHGLHVVGKEDARTKRRTKAGP